MTWQIPSSVSFSRSGNLPENQYQVGQILSQKIGVLSYSSYRWGDFLEVRVGLYRQDGSTRASVRVLGWNLLIICMLKRFRVLRQGTREEAKCRTSQDFFGCECDSEGEISSALFLQRC